MEIKSHSHNYAVVECDSVAAALAPPDDASSTFYLADQRVAELYSRQFGALPADRIFRIEASEEAKSYERMAPVFYWLLESGCRRNSRLVVIGGGVLQDIGCFAASVLMRGIRWTLVPTTLLAQCDSCIGSKSSLNVGRFKNQLGTFYSPHEVRLAVEFLGTLTQKEILSGLGEAIKLHLIDGPASVERLRGELASLGAASLPLRKIVWDSLTIKKRYIEEDEFDRGVRNLLNYGHTFAHAFEPAAGYAIPHGIAVSLGVACATYVSEQLGLAPAGSFKELLAWLKPCFGGCEDVLRRVDAPTVIAGMKRDKKNDGDKITLIATRGPGSMEKIGLEADGLQGLMQGCIGAL
jgi:3-dehydroquinate synthase